MSTAIRNGFAGALCAGLLLAISPPALAQGAGPGDAALQTRYDELFQEMLDRPADLDLMFAFAEVATRLGEYDAAISTLERMLLFNPDLPRVRLELGALYMRVGANEVARTYLRDAIDRPEVPPAVRARVQALLDELDRRTSRHVVGGSVLAGIRYQTNANAGPNSSQVLAGGLGFELDDRFRKQDDFNSFLSGLVVHLYNLDTPYQEFWETRAIAYGAAQFTLEDLDLALLEVQTGPRLSVLPESLPNTTLRPFVLGNAVTLDYDLLYTTVGVGAELRHLFGDRLQVAFQPVLRWRDFRNTETQPNADDESGVQTELSLGARYRLTEDLLLVAGLGYANENAKAEYESNDEYGATVGLTWAYPSPLGPGAVPWEVSLGAGFTATDYKQPDPGIAPGRERRDEAWQFSLGNSFRMTEAWSIEAQLQYIVNDSNIRNFDRDNLVVLIGALATF